MRQVARKGLITVVATGGVLAATGGYAYADAGAIGTAAGSPGVLSGNNVQVPVHVPVNLCGNTVDVIGVLNPAFGNTCANESHGPAGGAGGAGAIGRTAGSPGVLSGNTAQVPVHVPVNLCGNSVDPVGVLNPTFGNRCSNVSQGGAAGGGGALAGGRATGSPGVGSGNTAQVPVHVPVNVCGDTVDVIGVLNPAFGNTCGNSSTPPPVLVSTPPRQVHQPPKHCPPRRVQTPRHAKGPKHANRTPVAVHTGPEQQLTLAHTGVDQLGLIGTASAGLLLGGFVLYRRGRALRG